jgi:nitroreductase
MMMLEQLNELVKSQQTSPDFNTQLIDKAVLVQLAEIARWAPSEHNLQPTKLLYITEDNLKTLLYSACLKQRTVLDAPVLAVFCSDRNAVKHNLEKVLKLDMGAGAINTSESQEVKEQAASSFGQNPYGPRWLLRALLSPFMRLLRPQASPQTIHSREWLSKQAMLMAMNFTLAATAAELNAVPIEQFDEARVKKALGIPYSFVVPIIIAIGYSDEKTPGHTRLDFDDIVYWNNLNKK